MINSYKLGNLPTTFKTRTLQGKYTVFKDDDEKFIVYIDTDFLNKNSSILKDGEINMSETDNKLFDILSEKIGDREDVTITLDNTGAIILAKPDTQEEVVIEADQLPAMESVFDFLTENNINFSDWKIHEDGKLGGLIKTKNDKEANINEKKVLLSALVPIVLEESAFHTEVTKLLKYSKYLNKDIVKNLNDLAKSYNFLVTKLKKVKESADTPEVQKAITLEKQLRSELKNTIKSEEGSKKDPEELKAKLKQLLKDPENNKEEIAQIKMQLNMSEKKNFDDSDLSEKLLQKLSDALTLHAARIYAAQKTLANLDVKSDKLKNKIAEVLSKQYDLLVKLNIDESKATKVGESLLEPVQETLASLDKEEQEQFRSIKRKIEPYIDEFIKCLPEKLQENRKIETFLKQQGFVKAFKAAKEGDDRAIDKLLDVCEDKFKLDKDSMTKVNKFFKEEHSEDSKENDDKDLDLSGDLDFSEAVEYITKKYVTNFDAHQVKDSEFGITWEDKFGSLWSANPDEDPEAKLVWESADGKERPTDTPVESEEEESSEEGSDDLGLDDDEGGDLGDDGSESEGDDDLDLGDESSEDDLDLGDDSDTESNDESFSEDDDLDLDLEDDSSDDSDLDLGDGESSEDNDLDLDLESDDSESDDLNLEDDSGDFKEDDELDSDLTEESQESNDENLSKALDVIHDMYNKMVDKIK